MVLWASAGGLAATAGLLTLATYLFVYTPLKRRSSTCVPIGAVAGAMPPIIGYIAAARQLSWAATCLFSILFVWQIPHVYAIAVMYREDYERGGLKMMPDRGRRGNAPGQQIVAWSVLLILASVSPAMLGIAGAAYVSCAVLLGAMCVFQGTRFLIEPNAQQARHVLLASVVYLPVLLAAMVIDSSSTAHLLRAVSH
jgi:protoheme IX farnesyltransferase